MAMSCWSVCVREEPELLVTVVELGRREGMKKERGKKGETEERG